MTKKTLFVWIALFVIPYIIGAMMFYIGGTWFTIPTLCFLIFWWFAGVGHLVNVSLQNNE